MYSLCESDIYGQNGIVLTESGIYTLRNADGTTGFYMDLNMLLEISQKDYNNILDFIKDIETLQKRHDECLIFNTINDKTTRDALSIMCTFYKDPSILIQTIKNTLLSKLSDKMINDYLTLLKKKAESKNMTTFEYFTYYAILSKLNNTNELILIK